MGETKFDRVLKEVARRHHMSIQEARNEMQAAMEEGQRTTDPAVQALWASIPRKGAVLTLEEFISFIADKTKSPPL